MKYLLILTMLWFCGCKEKKQHVLHEMENVAVPEEYRKIIGKDSMQIFFATISKKWLVNFCYPNKWGLGNVKDMMGIDSIIFTNGIVIPYSNADSALIDNWKPLKRKVSIDEVMKNYKTKK